MVGSAASAALRAVLFDWGGTLVSFEWDEALLAAGHEAGLAAIGRAGEAAAFTERFRSELLPGLGPADDYAALLGRELEVGDEEVARFLRAEHDAWRPATSLLASAHALLESLRAAGLKLAIVANHWPEPAWVVREEIAELGVLERVDAVVLSGEGGARKPEPAIFEQALEVLDVEPFEAMFVGDRLEADVGGAGRLGLITVQALWFRADDGPGREPDFLAFTPMDVLTAVRRLPV